VRHPARPSSRAGPLQPQRHALQGLLKSSGSKRPPARNIRPWVYGFFWVHALKPVRDGLCTESRRFLHRPRRGSQDINSRASGGKLIGPSSRREFCEDGADGLEQVAVGHESAGQIAISADEIGWHRVLILAPFCFCRLQSR
jgi:hypothetical protein